METYHVKPYRGAWLPHLLHFQFRTAFCALFGIARWHFPAWPCPIIDNLGLTISDLGDSSGSSIGFMGHATDHIVRYTREV